MKTKLTLTLASELTSLLKRFNLLNLQALSSQFPWKIVQTWRFWSVSSAKEFKAVTHNVTSRVCFRVQVMRRQHQKEVFVFFLDNKNINKKLEKKFSPKSLLTEILLSFQYTIYELWSGLCWCGLQLRPLVVGNSLHKCSRRYFVSVRENKIKTTLSWAGK